MSDHHTGAAAIPKRLLDAAAAGCADSRMLINRRALMGVSAGLFSWAMLPRLANAAVTDPRLLIVILRGGMDGLQIAIPRNNADYDIYKAARPGVALEGDTNLYSATPDFYLNKSLTNFISMFNDGDAAVIPAVAPPLRNRSHFHCQDNLENGYGGKVQYIREGWLNRFLQVLQTDGAVRQHQALAVSKSPLILQGREPVLSWSAARFSHGPNATFKAALNEYYDAVDPRLEKLLTDADAADARSGKAAMTGTDLQIAFGGAGKLMSDPEGPRIAVVSVESWDTHVNEPTTLASMLTGLDGAFASFKKAIGAEWRNTVVLCVSEFGRTLNINAKNGTEHGVGTAALLLGGAVRKQIYADRWPTLAKSRLVDGRDVWPTTDLRSVFKGVLMEHFGISPDLLETAQAGVSDAVFPESKYAPALQGLTKDPAIVSQPDSEEMIVTLQSISPGPQSLQPAMSARPASTGLGRFRQANQS